MVALDISKKDLDLSWVLPTCIIPRPNKTVRIVSDFRKVNYKLVRKPFAIPKISGII